MITVRLKGGLGNQLFQYATAYALAKRTDSDLCLDIRYYGNKLDRFYKLNHLNIKHSTITDEKFPAIIELLNNKYINKTMRKMNFKKLNVKGIRYLFDSSFISLNHNLFDTLSADTYIEGYYQSEEYFKEYRDDLLKQVVPVYEEETEYITALNEIQEVNSCAVHVRRGDFMNYQGRRGKNSVFYVLGFDYYKRAIEYISEHMSKPVFFWFSDDIEWVKENVGEAPNMRFVRLHTRNPDIDELMLMKHCNSIITANSSFSWWAAWLHENKEAVIVVPQRAYGNPYMIPENWIRI